MARARAGQWVADAPVLEMVARLRGFGVNRERQLKLQTTTNNAEGLINAAGWRRLLVPWTQRREILAHPPRRAPSARQTLVMLRFDPFRS